MTSRSKRCVASMATNHNHQQQLILTNHFKYTFLPLLFIFSIIVGKSDSVSFHVIVGNTTPSPLMNPSVCANWTSTPDGQEMYGYVCDPHHELSFEDKKRIGNATMEFERNTPCSCYDRNCLPPWGTPHGYFIGVAIDNAISIFDVAKVKREARQMLKQFAEAKDPAPKFGYCQDQILILLSQQKAFIVTGFNLKRHISNEEMDQIADRHQTSLASGNYPQAVTGMIQEIEKILIERHRIRPNIPLGIFLLVLIVLFVMGLVVYNRWQDDKDFKHHFMRHKGKAYETKINMNYSLHKEELFDIKWAKKGDRKGQETWRVYSTADTQQHLSSAKTVIPPLSLSSSDQAPLAVEEGKEYDTNY